MLKYSHIERNSDIEGSDLPEENVYLLVCHNALIRIMNAYFHPMPNETFFDFFVENTELVTFPSKHELNTIKS